MPERDEPCSRSTAEEYPMAHSLKTDFNIAHTAIQLEDESCGDLHAPMHVDEAHGDHSHAHASGHKH